MGYGGLGDGSRGDSFDRQYDYNRQRAEGKRQRGEYPYDLDGKADDMGKGKHRAEPEGGGCAFAGALLTLAALASAWYGAGQVWF